MVRRVSEHFLFGFEGLCRRLHLLGDVTQRRDELGTPDPDQDLLSLGEQTWKVLNTDENNIWRVLIANLLFLMRPIATSLLY